MQTYVYLFFGLILIAIIVGIVMGIKKDDKKSSPEEASPKITYSFTAEYYLYEDGGAEVSEQQWKISGTDKTGSVTSYNGAITLNVGDTLGITNTTTAHPLYIKDVPSTGIGNTVTNPQAFGQGAKNGNMVYWTPETPRTYYYQCSIHDSMHGTIIVQIPDNMFYFVILNFKTDNSGYVMENLKNSQQYLNPTIQLSVGEELWIKQTITNDTIILESPESQELLAEAKTEEILKFKPTEPGNYIYRSTTHPNIQGTITVNYPMS